MVLVFAIGKERRDIVKYMWFELDSSFLNWSDKINREESEIDSCFRSNEWLK